MHQRARSDVRYALLANDATPRASAAVEVKAALIQEGPMHNTMGMGLAAPEDHSRMLERFKKEAMG